MLSVLQSFLYFFVFLYFLRADDTLRWLTNESIARGGQEKIKVNLLLINC